MKNSGRPLLLIAGVLLVLGIIAFPLQNVLDPEPEPECAEPGTPYSGMVEGDCNITDASFQEIRDWESSTKWYRVGGLVLIVLALVIGVTSLVLSRRSRAEGPAAPGDGTAPPNGPPAG